MKWATDYSVEFHLNIMKYLAEEKYSKGMNKN